jgi:lipoprotein-releasing system ATP-binding protein
MVKLWQSSKTLAKFWGNNVANVCIFEKFRTYNRMLQSKQLTFSYSSTKHFSFPDIHCADREALLILGKSGTGKTTLLHLLALLLRPQSGSVIINQTDMTGLSPAQTVDFRAANVGIVYQKPHFVSSLSVMDNLLLANYLSHKPQQKDRARQLADQLGFGSHLAKKTNQLSQGEQQRVSIARAVMNQPGVILADEPTSNLDDDNCARVLTLLREQSEHIGASLIIVTHDQRLKDEISNQVLL